MDKIVDTVHSMRSVEDRKPIVRFTTMGKSTSMVVVDQVLASDMDSADIEEFIRTLKRVRGRLAVAALEKD